MADFARTLASLNGAALGAFGAGHLGRVVIQGLVDNGFPVSRLLVCHGGSPDTTRRLAEAGLSERVVGARELARHSRIILYLVRPQSLAAIEGLELMNDSLIVSFLAGTPLTRIPARAGQGGRVRVMTSAPDTIMKSRAIAGVYPPGNPAVQELLDALNIEQFPLDKEGDMHAFTALGVCLPIVLAFWRAQGKGVDAATLMNCAQKHGLGRFEEILRWALRVEPRFEAQTEREAYIRKAATPGGVTEAMIQRIRAGGNVTQALESGILRSQELSGG